MLTWGPSIPGNPDGPSGPGGPGGPLGPGINFGSTSLRGKGFKSEQKMDFQDFDGRGFYFLLDIKTEQRLFTATCGRRGGGSVQPGDARWTRRSWVKKGR